MPFRLALFSCSFLLCGTWSRAALAQAPSTTNEDVARDVTTPNVKNEVVVGVSGPLDAEARSTLIRLLRAELEGHGLVLIETDPNLDARSWARDVTQGEKRLLAALLETKGSAGWRLVVIDAARGRAISRELPQGERDAANVEAVVSIVLSATNALREGLEVASAPLESVVDPERPRATIAPPPAEPEPEPEPARAKGAPTRGTSLHASATALGASFAENAEPTFGASLALGASFASVVEADFGVARHLPVSVESDFGSFELGRTSLALSVGPAFGGGAIVFVPSLGATVEWIRRSSTRASEGVGVDDDSKTISRFGGVLAMRGRLRLISNGNAELVSLVGGVSAAYFGERVRFLAGDDVLTEVRRSSFEAELGLFFATGPL